METKSKNYTIKTFLVIATIGIWLNVLQNAGILRNKAEITNVVDINGNVKVKGKTDVNISAINGHEDAFYGPSKNGKYDAIHVYYGR